MKFQEFAELIPGHFPGAFTAQQAIAAIPGASQASVYRWLEKMVTGGLLTEDGRIYQNVSAMQEQLEMVMDPTVDPVAEPTPESTVAEVVEESYTPEANPINAEAIASFAYKKMGEIRTTMVDGEPWFCLNDICDVLLIANPRAVSSRLDEDEKGRCLLDTLGGKQYLTFVNESGLYSAIMRSDKPEAKPFRKWITSEVLPAIRKTGRYEAEPQKPLSQLEMLAAMAQEAVKSEKRLGAVEAEVEALKQRRLQAEKELNLLPSASVPAVPKSTRAKINERVAAYSAATLLDHAAVHRKLHKEFYYRHHINLHARFMADRDKYKSKLDIVEELGLMEEYLAIACEVLGVA